MKYPILGRERWRPIALSAVGTVLVLAFACVLFTLTVLAIQRDCCRIRSRRFGG